MAQANQGGFTFNELLVAMALVVVMVMGYSLTSAGLIRRQVANNNSSVAMHLAQDKIEELQARRMLIDSDSCPDAGDRGISSRTGVAGVFDRCWKVAASPLGAALRQIDVTVSWRDHETHALTLSTLIYIGD